MAHTFADFWILFLLCPDQRPPLSGAQTSQQVMVRRKPQKLCPCFHWYARVMLLILRNFKVKIMSLLVLVIFCVLCSFLPICIIYLVWVWQSQAKRQPGPSWYPPWKVIQFQSIWGTDSGLLSPRPRIALGDLSRD